MIVLEGPLFPLAPDLTLLSASQPSPAPWPPSGDGAAWVPLTCTLVLLTWMITVASIRFRRRIPIITPP